MTIEGLETYILTFRDPGDLDLLVEALRPNPTPMDLDMVHWHPRPDRAAGAVQ